MRTVLTSESVLSSVILAGQSTAAARLSGLLASGPPPYV
jgi:hypothetical protein